MAKDDEKPRYTHSNRDYRPEAGLTFRAVEQNARKDYLEDLQGYEGCCLEIFYGPEKTYDNRIYLSSDSPDDFMKWLLNSCHMNLWLGTPLDLDLVERFKETDKGRAIQEMLDSIYDLPHDDTEQLVAICGALTNTYTDFLIDSAADIFKGGIRNQLAWLTAVNGFEDNMSVSYTPLKTIGAQCVKNLIESSRALRADEVARASAISPEYAQAIKVANEFMDDCIGCFSEGVEYGGETIHFMLPSMPTAYIQAIDDNFPVDFMDSIERAVSKPSVK